MKNKIAIFGTGGHAKVIYDIILKENKFLPGAFFSLENQLSKFLELPHFHQDELIKSEFTEGIIAVGDNWTRANLAKKILMLKPNFKFITAIHPSAIIGRDVTIGQGTVIMAQTVVNPFSFVGDHVILNTSSSVDHDCKLENYSSIAPGCVLGGNIKVGEYSAISLGANIIHGKTIGSHSVVGAGSLVVTDIEKEVVAYGVPCKTQRKRQIGEKYL